MAYTALQDRMTTISHRFLLAVTGSIIALLSVLLVLYVGLLFLYTLSQRSEWAYENYAGLLREVLRQEYFVARFPNFLPDYLCGSDANCKQDLDWTESLPPQRQLTKITLSQGGMLWAFRNLATSGVTKEHEQQERTLLGLARRFTHLDRTVWGDLQSTDQTFLTTVDGTLGIFIRDEFGQQSNADKFANFAQRKLTAFQEILRDHPEARNAEGVYWTDAIEDPITNRYVFTCFIPLRDAKNTVIGFASTDISATLVLKRVEARKKASRRNLGSVLIYSDQGQLMLIDGRPPTASQIALHPKPNKDYKEYKVYNSSLQFHLNGAVIQVSDVVPNINWRVVYEVGIWDLMGDKIVSIGAAILIYLIFVIGLLFGTWHIGRTVIQPARLKTKRLADSENFNRTVVEASPVGLAVLRECDGSVILQNAQFVPLSRWRLLDDADQSIEGEVWPNLLRWAKNQNLVLHLEDGDSGCFYQIGIATAMLKEEPVMICVLSDMTDRKRTQQALAEAKLYAESTSAAKSLFLATISHEIRTPLYGMLASVELIAKTRLDDIQLQLVQTMDNSVRTLKDVLNDALDFTKVETKNIELECQEFDLTKEVESVVQGFASRASLKDVELYCLIDPTLSGLWWGDAIKLVQVLNNLLNNAVKFTESGSVTIAVRLIEVRSPGTCIEFSVQDTGAGIAEEDRECIFQPFGQGDVSHIKQQVAGTGLGLFICQKFVDMMDGAINVVSTPGIGTTFIVTITLTRSGAMQAVIPAVLQGLTFAVNAAPAYGEHLASLLTVQGGVVTLMIDDAYEKNGCLARIDVSDSVVLQNTIFLDKSFPLNASKKDGQWFVNPLSGQALIDTVLMAAGRKVLSMEEQESEITGSSHYKTDASVLIVDDQAINRLLLEKQLSYFGCQVTTACSGEEALQYAQHFDLILTDLNMPGMNGYQLVRQLRANAVSSPIVAVTASLLPGERERCHAAGMDGHLVKPFTMEDVEKVLERYIDLRCDLSEKETEEMAIQALSAASQRWQPEMMKIAVASIVADLDVLSDAVASADIGRLGKIAHRIHGGMATLEMRPAAALCQTIAESIEFEWHEEAFQLAPVLQRMLEQIRLDIDVD